MMSYLNLKVKEVLYVQIDHLLNSHSKQIFGI